MIKILTQKCYKKYHKCTKMNHKILVKILKVYVMQIVQLKKEQFEQYILSISLPEKFKETLLKGFTNESHDNTIMNVVDYVIHIFPEYFICHRIDEYDRTHVYNKFEDNFKEAIQACQFEKYLQLSHDSSIDLSTNKEICCNFLTLHLLTCICHIVHKYYGKNGKRHEINHPEKEKETLYRRSLNQIMLIDQSKITNKNRVMNESGPNLVILLRPEWQFKRMAEKMQQFLSLFDEVETKYVTITYGKKTKDISRKIRQQQLISNIYEQYTIVIFGHGNEWEVGLPNGLACLKREKLIKCFDKLFMDKKAEVILTECSAHLQDSQFKDCKITVKPLSDFQLPSTLIIGSLHVTFMLHILK